MALFTAALWLGGTDINNQLNWQPLGTVMVRIIGRDPYQKCTQKPTTKLVSHMINIILPLKI